MRDQAHRFAPSARPGHEHTCDVDDCGALEHDEEHTGGVGVDPPVRVSWKPGDLCLLGGRSTFKVGYVVGPSRSTGKTTVKSFSANKRRFSNAFALADELVLPLPAREARKPCHARTIRLAVIASAAERRDARASEMQRAARREAAQIEAASASKSIDSALVAATVNTPNKR